MVPADLMHIDMVVVGPTASGKTLWAFNWALRHGAEIISADSRQIYREMDIGTAKPSAYLRQEVTHHLLDILHPGEPYSAGQFVRDARLAIRDIRSRGKKIVLVGGTGLYIKALLFGLLDLGPEDAHARETFDREMDCKDTEALYEDLVRKDPDRADKVSSRDRYRILRALWLIHSSGMPASRLYAGQAQGNAGISYGDIVGLSPLREILYERINDRVDEMFANGWIEEVMDLQKKGYDRNAPGFRSLGYREILDYLSGLRGFPETVVLVKQKTRQFAKRQMTWFRNMAALNWISGTGET